jgi:adenosylcobinamide-phosphate synthase
MALALDLCWGEPPAGWHPVVWMGQVIGALERRAPAGDAPPAARLLYGVAVVGASIALFVLPARLLERVLWRAGWPGIVVLGALLKPAFAAGELFRATARVGDALGRDDLAGAREGLRSLVSRDTTSLSATLMAAAAIESVAENSSDSVVAPLFYYGLWGLPGAVAYRVVNTLDAMLGYRTPRYELLGKAAARLDDVANLVPARLTGALIVLAAPAAGGSVGAAAAALRRDHGRTASPNAGWPMAAAAGALGVTLEKVGQYRLNRGGREPGAVDVRRSIDLTRGALSLGLPLLVALLWRSTATSLWRAARRPSRKGG